MAEEISAATADAAVALFESRGYSDVRLHSHEWFESALAAKPQSP